MRCELSQHCSGTAEQRLCDRTRALGSVGTTHGELNLLDSEVDSQRRAIPAESQVVPCGRAILKPVLCRHGDTDRLQDMILAEVSDNLGSDRPEIAVDCVSTHHRVHPKLPSM